MRFNLPPSLAARLSREDIICLKLSARNAQIMENRWQAKFKEFFKDLDRQAAAWLECNESMAEFPFVDDILPLLLQHQYEVMHVAIVTAEREKELKKKVKLGKTPRSLQELFRLYEKWRQRVDVPKVQIKRAKEIKKAYIQKVQKVWVQRGRDFREGREYSREKAVKTIQEHTKMPRARAEMTVQTETTRFYNEGRRAVYDKMDDVTHYLFVAIRDFATTKWCRSRQGVVFEKDSDLFELNVPPVHWNCRSEILPLTPLNPNHLRLIKNKSLAAENRTLVPLPKGWTSGKARM